MTRYMGWLTRYMGWLTRYMGLLTRPGPGPAPGPGRAPTVPVRVVPPRAPRGRARALSTNPCTLSTNPCTLSTNPYTLSTNPYTLSNQIMDLAFSALGTLTGIWTLKNGHVLGCFFGYWLNFWTYGTLWDPIGTLWGPIGTLWGPIGTLWGPIGPWEQVWSSHPGGLRRFFPGKNDTQLPNMGKARPTQPSQGKASQAAEPNQPAQKSAFGLPGGSARGTFLEFLPRGASGGFFPGKTTIPSKQVSNFVFFVTFR